MARNFYYRQSHGHTTSPSSSFSSAKPYSSLSLSTLFYRVLVYFFIQTSSYYWCECYLLLHYNSRFLFIFLLPILLLDIFHRFYILMLFHDFDEVLLVFFFSFLLVMESILLSIRDIGYCIGVIEHIKVFVKNVTEFQFPLIPVCCCVFFFTAVSLNNQPCFWH